MALIVHIYAIFILLLLFSILFWNTKEIFLQKRRDGTNSTYLLYFYRCFSYIFCSFYVYFIRDTLKIMLILIFLLYFFFLFIFHKIMCSSNDANISLILYSSLLNLSIQNLNKVYSIQFLHVIRIIYIYSYIS